MIWQDGPVTIHIGDAFEVLRELPAESVQCVVTSPPYWGLRDYGTAQWEGGETGCDHSKDRSTGVAKSTLVGSTTTQNHQQEPAYREICGKCGARRIDSQLGLEATPEEYIAAMVEVFREVRRVLRKDGTLWLNMGDSYATGAGAVGQHPGGGAQGNGWMGPTIQPNRLRLPGLKPKDLVGIPWRLAFALQADGWWLRSDIVWSKPNPMPESVTDRPTKAHEYIFLLTKSARYFYDAEAVREAVTQESGWAKQRAHGEDTWAYGRTAGGNITNGVGGTFGNPAGRNLRSVWTIATQPYPEAHFATFPEELARRCIAAGTSERGCCPECGAPWDRQTSTEYIPHGPNAKAGGDYAGGERTSGDLTHGRFRPQEMPNGRATRVDRTTGWQPTCAHAAKPVPCTVLDPFCGSGTTLAVARRLSRRAVGIELQPSYLPLIQRRVSEAALPLLEAISQ